MHADQHIRRHNDVAPLTKTRQKIGVEAIREKIARSSAASSSTANRSATRNLPSAPHERGAAR